ncbi:LecA/PA-IL family lectin [Acidobacteriota bacterium]
MKFFKVKSLLYLLSLFLFFSFTNFNLLLYSSDVTKQYRVYANVSAGKNTNIHVKKGDTISITANGTWCWGQCGTCCCTAEGTPGRPNAGERPTKCSGVIFGKLIAKINNICWQIGSNRKFISNTSGNLSLAMNDRVGWYHDNSGYLNVSVRIKRIPKKNKKIDIKKPLVIKKEEKKKKIKTNIFNLRSKKAPKDNPDLKKMKHNVEIYKIIIERENSFAQLIEIKSQECIHGILHLEITRRYKEPGTKDSVTKISHICDTLEHPWIYNISSNDSKAKPAVRYSNIPANKYEAYIRWKYSREGIPSIKIRCKNVPNRNGIDIHCGNRVWHSTGCILVGWKTKECTLVRSRVALAKLLNLLPKKFSQGKAAKDKVEQFLYVEIIDPSKIL